MSRLSDSYDWVVLGDHPGALLSASLAAKLGLSVLVLPLAPSLKLTISKDGQHLDPETNFMLGLAPQGRGDRAPGLLAECLTRLGILPAELELVRGPAEPQQILTPTARVLFGGEAEALAAELRRELGPDVPPRWGLTEALAGAGPELASYWRGLPARLTVVPGKTRETGSRGESRPNQEKRTSSELRRAIVRGAKGPAAAWTEQGRRVSDLSRLPEFSSLRELCRGLWFATTAAASDDPETDRLLQAATLMGSAATFRGGMTAYRDYLLRLARRLGAHVPPKAECRRVFIDDGRFVGVQVASRGSMISGRAAALGCSVSLARESFAVSGRSLFHKLSPPPVPSGWRFTLALTVGIEAIPPGMTTRSVWQESGAPILELEVVDPEDFGVRQAGRQEVRILNLRTVLPFTQESLAPAYQRLIAARMLRQAGELLPFLDRHLVSVYPEFRSPQLGELSEVYGFPLPELVPENLRVHSGKGMGARTGYEGLFVVSGESFPELGTLGPTVAAIESVAWLAHRSGLAGPFV